MKKKYLMIFMAALFAVGISSCREETAADDMEDAVEEAGEELED